MPPHPADPAAIVEQILGIKSFLLLFFKKEVLAFSDFAKSRARTQSFNQRPL